MQIGCPCSRPHSSSLWVLLQLDIGRTAGQDDDLVGMAPGVALWLTCKVTSPHLDHSRPPKAFSSLRERSQ